MSSERCCVTPSLSCHLLAATAVAATSDTLARLPRMSQQVTSPWGERERVCIACRLSAAVSLTLYAVLCPSVPAGHPSSSLLISSLALSDTNVYAPQVRARLGTTAHFCKAAVLKHEPALVWNSLTLFVPLSGQDIREQRDATRVYICSLAFVTDWFCRFVRAGHPRAEDVRAAAARVNPLP